ncbi:hypothetical protein [Companilactobacillus nuruki]|uniref:hypothetical protein n=1 Tax=Companilactobacillus nuruki TaxID=1993540 RepID=UPI0014170D68|nr:hypothetical protein [Companilactobacillus nuruki]
MKNKTHSTINNYNSQSYSSDSWITSEILVGMYSKIFTNLLLIDNQIFKKNVSK